MGGAHPTPENLFGSEIQAAHWSDFSGGEFSAEWICGANFPEVNFPRASFPSTVHTKHINTSRCLIFLSTNSKMLW